MRLSRPNARSMVLLHGTLLLYAVVSVFAKLAGLRMAAQDAGMAAEFGCVNPEICPAATDGDPDGPVPPGFPQIAGVGKETVRHAMGSGAVSRHRTALSAGEKEKDVLEYTPAARPLCPDLSTGGKACVREGLCFVHEEGLGGSIILRIREDQTTSLRIL